MDFSKAGVIHYQLLMPIYLRKYFFFFAKKELTYVQIDDTDKNSKNQSKNVA